MKRRMILISLTVLATLATTGACTSSTFQLLHDADEIEGTKCVAGSVQAANDGQLYSILSELVKTPFFRLFRVNVKDAEKSDLCAAFQGNKKEGVGEKSGGQCGGDMSKDPFGWPGQSAGSSLNSGQPPSLCSVEADKEPFPTATTPPVSNAPRPFEQVDKRISVEESAITKEEFEDDCGEDPTGDFWLDICEGTSPSSTLSAESDYVNLQLNQERNTGYKGARIWEAIYAENCHQLGNGNDDEAVCLEQDILSRLIGGVHSSTSVAIAKNYFPPGAGGRTGWKSNPAAFMERVGNHPERVKNLHFAFIVLLRALFKVKPILQQMEFHPPSNPNPDLDHSTRLLVHHLLEASVMKSCSLVLDSFDESVMFPRRVNVATKKEPRQDTQEALARKFKAVFRNITSLIDCVTCQRCRLHAKVSTLGVGSALKILLTPSISKLKARLGREEIVALVNTVHKLSESIRISNELATEYQSLSSPDPEKARIQNTSPEMRLSANERRARVDKALSLTAELSRAGLLSHAHEAAIIDLVVKGEKSEMKEGDIMKDDLLALAHHFGHSAKVFGEHASRLLFNTPPKRGGLQHQTPDAVIVGGGLAGMVAAISLLDRGGNVLFLEKQGFLGGNSAKASSGINAINMDLEHPEADSFDLFLSDTLKSADGLGQSRLANVLVNRSVEVVEWLSKRCGLPLPRVSQLGGHSRKRTWRPEKGMVGAELTMALGKTLREEYEGKGLELIFNAELVALIRSSTRNGGVKVVGVEYRVDGRLQQRLTPSVILATGGFGYDSDGLLRKHRPDLLHLPTTLGTHSTGDGIKIAVTDVNAKLIDMPEVQLHPTGFVDPKDVRKQIKVLAAEMLRGIGGLLIDPTNNQRFVNELGTRAFVTEQMFLRAAQSKLGDSPVYWILLNDRCVQKGNAERHIKLYALKGLLKEVKGIKGLEEIMKDGESTIGASSIRATLREYAASMVGTDSRPDFTGKTTFFGESSWYFPLSGGEGEEDDSVWWLGQVTPVIHYTMGGVAIDEHARVLSEIKGETGGEGSTVDGLYAIGEVSGGVHGKNRLGGNSLLECAVFGRIVGSEITVTNPEQNERRSNLKSSDAPAAASTTDQLRYFQSLSEVSTVSQLENKVLVALFGDVYDLTSYFPEHPGGKQAILDVSGKDGTEIFSTVHARSLLDDMGFTPMGKIKI